MAPKTCGGSAPADPVPTTSAEAATSEAKSSGLAPASSEAKSSRLAPMLTSLSSQIEGKNVVRQGNAVLKLARLGYHGDRDAQGFLPSWDFPDQPRSATCKPKISLPDVLSTPVWLQNQENKQSGEFDYENGPFVEFQWRELWAMYIAQHRFPEFMSVPQMLRCDIECDQLNLDVRSMQQFGSDMGGYGFYFKFTGVLEWQLPRRTLVQPFHFQCSNVI